MVTLQLTNITLSFDVKSESVYYVKTGIKCDLERSYCPPNHAIKATVIWEPDNLCRNFYVGKSYARLIKFQKQYFLEALGNNESNSGHKHKHMCIPAAFKHTYVMNLHFLVLKLSQKFSINVRMIAPIMLHSTTAFLFNAKILNLTQAKHQPTFKMYT